MQTPNTNLQTPRLIELTAEQVSELIALNATAPNNMLVTPISQSGRHVIADDLLQDCGAGQTFEHFGNFLRSLGSAGVPPAPVGVAPNESAARDAQQGDRDGRATRTKRSRSNKSN